MRRASMVLMALGLVAAACGSTQSAPITVSGPAAVPQDTIGTPAPTMTTTTIPEEPTLSPEVMAQIDELIAATEDLRGLKFVTSPDVVVVTDDELEQRLRDQLEEDLDPEEVKRDDALLTLLGVLQHDQDLGEVYTELIAGQVAGYYDPDLDELVVPTTKSGFTIGERVTLVHELTHALADQHFDLGSKMDSLEEAESFDALDAFHAVIEGEATWIQFEYVLSLPRREQLEFFEEAFSEDSGSFDAAPYFLQESLLFPYSAGYGFVLSIVGTGGDTAVNGAYERPPLSTEQVIDPDKYVSAEAVVPLGLPEFDLPGYRLEEASTWGQLGFRLLFGDTLDTAVAVAAEDGWGGDAYGLWWDGFDVFFYLVYAGDEESDNTEMAEGLREYVDLRMDVGSGTAAFGGTEYTGEDYAFVLDYGGGALFIAASDPEAGRSVTAILMRQ